MLWHYRGKNFCLKYLLIFCFGMFSIGLYFFDQIFILSNQTSRNVFQNHMHNVFKQFWKHCFQNVFENIWKCFSKSHAHAQILHIWKCKIILQWFCIFKITCTQTETEYSVPPTWQFILEKFSYWSNQSKEIAANNLSDLSLQLEY